MLKNALLHVLKPTVVGIEHLRRLRKIELILPKMAPGHLAGPVEIASRHPVLRRLGLEHGQLLKLFFEALAHHRRKGPPFEALSEALRVGLAIVLAQPELLLDVL